MYFSSDKLDRSATQEKFEIFNQLKYYDTQTIFTKSRTTGKGWR